MIIKISSKCLRDVKIPDLEIPPEKSNQLKKLQTNNVFPWDVEYPNWTNKRRDSTRSKTSGYFQKTRKDATKELEEKMTYYIKTNS